MSAITISRTGATVRSPALLPQRRPWTGWRMCTTEGWRITCPWSSSVAPFTAVWTTLCTLSAHLPAFYNNFTQTSREFREFSVCSKFYSDLQYIWIHALKAFIHSLFIIHVTITIIFMSLITCPLLGLYMLNICKYTSVSNTEATLRM